MGSHECNRSTAPLTFEAVKFDFKLIITKIVYTRFEIVVFTEDWCGSFLLSLDISLENYTVSHPGRP